MKSKKLCSLGRKKTNAVEKKTEDLTDVVSTLVKELAGIKQQLADKSTWAKVAGAGPKEGAGAAPNLTGANTVPLGRTMIQKEHVVDIAEEAKKEEILDKARGYC